MTTTNHDTSDLADRDLAKEYGKGLVLPIRYLHKYRALSDSRSTDDGHCYGIADIRFRGNDTNSFADHSGSERQAAFGNALAAKATEIFLGIDYRSLLKKYIEHVGSIEGHNYIGDNMGTVDFTPQELEELKRLSEEKI